MYGLVAMSQSAIEFRGHMSVSRRTTPTTPAGSRRSLAVRPLTSVVTFVANPEANVSKGSSTGSSKGTSFGASSNVIPVSPARQAMEAEVQRILEQEKTMYTYSGSSVENYEVVESKEHLKSLVGSSSYGATLVMFGSPGCRSCRSIEPKVKSLAEQNPDVLFAKVNTAEDGMASVAAGLGVPSLPYFMVYSKKADGPNEEKELLSSFTCNLHSIDVLRAEISGVKECIETGCSF